MTADQLLAHPWISSGGCNIHTPLTTPTNLRRQVSIKQLEDFASRAMAVNRAVTKSETWGGAAEPEPVTGSMANTLTASCRMTPRQHLWDVKKMKCFSINELHSMDSDPIDMKAIV